MHGGTLIGADLGKVTTSLAWGHLADDGALVVDGTRAARHMGDPMAPFFALYGEITGTPAGSGGGDGSGAPAGSSTPHAAVSAVAATGAFGDRLGAPVWGGIPEEIALERAAELLQGADGPLNIVRIGGSGYSVLTRDAAGRIEYETNERCSAGTGETVEGLCSRLGCTLDEAIALASAADRGIAVTSRCAVFAKSELTHFANQGEDHGRLFLGLFESVARNVHALYDRAKVDGPVVLVGHGALIAPLADAFAAAAGQAGGARRDGTVTDGTGHDGTAGDETGRDRDRRRATGTSLGGGPVVSVSPEAGVFEALGALRFAAQRAAGRSAESTVSWPADPAGLVTPRRGRIRALTPADAGPGSIVRLNGSAAAGTPSARVGALSVDHVGATTIAAAGTPAGARPDPGAVVLGLDLGSSGSKAVLYDAASGAVIADVYRRTDGNPIEAAKRLIEDLELGSGVRYEAAGRPAPVSTSGAAPGAPPVVAIGVTGSGRDAVATVLAAAYPELGARITVLNEIVAHAAAAVRYDADGGRSLSIVEIGGQDAKFINVREGRVLESDMNRVCSAGTGSFLEEQAQAHGLDDVAVFGEFAARSENPPDLGTTCTVFVADVAAEALADGFTRDDIFAGLQYSVIRNYIGRVMGDRRFLDRIFFQGKPATNPSLARTLAAVTGREVVVPPNPGAMGALGIAMLAAEALEAADGAGADEGIGRARRGVSPAFGLGVFLSAEVVSRKTGRCGDRKCSNLCRLETAVVEVAGERRRVVSGGNCPKYDSVAAVGTKLPQDAPTPFRERDELLATSSAEAKAAAARVRIAAGPGGAALGGMRIGLPYAHYLIDTLPFFETFFAHLGADVRVLLPTVETLAVGDRRCAAPGACAPVKIAHGLTGGGTTPIDVLFSPKLINLPPDGASGTYTCPIAQGTPEMLDHALRAEAGNDRRDGNGRGDAGAAAAANVSGPPFSAPRIGDDTPFVLRPVFLPLTAHAFDSDEFTAELREAARSLGVAGVAGDAAFRAAHSAALVAWERYRTGLREIGARALAFARAEGFPVVLVVGETHVVHDPVINSGIHDLIAANGAVALPLDCFPVEDEVPGLLCVHWAGAGQTLRAAVAAASSGDVFPLLLCAYGCGPNSFVEHLFDDLLADYPHTVLESDGHGGAAGYITRVQAFLHAVQGYRESRADEHDGGSRASAVDPGRLARCERPVMLSLRNNRERTFLFGNIGGSGGRFAAAAMRGAGIDARFVGATSPAALERGREGCSGKECLPYQLIWGTLAEYLAGHGDTIGPDGVVFVSIGRGFRACRPNLFPVAQQIQLERLGFKGSVDVGDFTLLFEDWTLTSSMWVGMATADLLNMMRFYHCAAEPRRGAADALHAAFADRLEALLAAPRLTGKTKGLGDARALLSGCERLIADAAREFAALENGPRESAALESAAPSRAAAGLAATGIVAPDLRTVYLCGDIYLRVDEWGNDDLQRKLADQGLRIVLEPYGEMFELLAERDARDYGLTSRQGAKRIATLKFMRYVIRRLLGAAHPHEPWLAWPDVGDVWDASEPLLDGYPFGESIPTIGGALHAWRTQPIDGVVVVSPRGCGPALVSEAQLRRGADFPLLFVYNDGDPIDEARLAGFAWRLREREPRLAPAPSAVSR